jgi:hypothetical protein
MSDTRLDHLVYATPDLDAAVKELEHRLGVRASPGGRHPGLGTRNALLALGEDCYLEVIGPDPEQPQATAPRPFGIDSLRTGRLVTWAIKERDLEARIEAAKSAGFDAGTILPMSRETPEGLELRWRLSLRPTPAGDGLVPFLIDWGGTPSPARAAAQGCSIVELRAEHPDPARVARDLEALAVELEVARAAAPALIARLDTPNGPVELR